MEGGEAMDDIITVVNLVTALLNLASAIALYKINR